MSDPAITLAICTNRLARVHDCCTANLPCLRWTDRCVIVLDVAQSAATDELVSRWGLEATIMINGSNRGLSFSRNLATSVSPTSHLVFIDDDVLLTPGTIDAIRQAFRNGYDIVGVRIDCPPGLRLPWYLSAGQMHYLGVHVGLGPYRTWGACMGLNLEFLRAFGLGFRDELGRVARQLASGDDTTLVAELKQRGAREVFLESVSVIHNFDPSRLRLRYPFRRAYWQGRSEVRRQAVIRGMVKEWRRFTSHHEPSIIRYSLASVYIAAFMAGLLREIFSASRWTAGRRHPNATGRSRASNAPEVTRKRPSGADQPVPGDELKEKPSVSARVGHHAKISPPWQGHVLTTVPDRAVVAGEEMNESLQETDRGSLS